MQDNVWPPSRSQPGVRQREGRRHSTGRPDKHSAYRHARIITLHTGTPRQIFCLSAHSDKHSGYWHTQTNILSICAYRHSSARNMDPIRIGGHTRHCGTRLQLGLRRRHGRAPRINFPEGAAWLTMVNACHYRSDKPVLLDTNSPASSRDGPATVRYTPNREGAPVDHRGKA